MVDFISPSVNIQVIEEELGATVGPGTVPLVFIATKSNKLNEAGEIAENTMPENAGRLELITSQRELLQKYGIPFFREVDGTVIQGDETNEYGLHAAFSYLGLANRCYIVRADLDTDQLLPTEDAPRGRPANGTYWFDSRESEFGLFVANGNSISGLAWNKVDVEIIDPSYCDPITGQPLAEYGNTDDIVINVAFNTNTYWQKTATEWMPIGSPAWSEATYPLVVASNGDPVADASVVNLTFTTDSNTETVTIANGDDATAVAANITSNVTGVSASVVDNEIVIDASGTNTTVTLSSSGSALSFYGLPEKISPRTLTYATHIEVPNGENTGAYWIKTTTPNSGAKFVVKRYNISTDEFETIDAPFYENDAEADAAYGNAKTVGTLYVRYNSTGADPETATQSIMRFNGSTWEVLVYEYGEDEPSTDPVEGTLWFNAALEADILVNTGNQWRGYRNVYPGTDPNGPQITSKMPTTQSTGAPLVNYDLWIKSDDVLAYPQIYRYLAGEWMLVDNLDRSTPLGIVYGDIREDSGPVGPWIKGGTRATGNAVMKANAVYVANPGEGYDDGVYTTTVIGGDYETTAVEIEVTVIDGNVLSAVLANTDHDYNELPPGGVNVLVSGIAGSPTTEASFNISWGVAEVDLTFGGAGYSVAPLISIVGGGGVGAKALTTIDTGLVDSVIITNSGQGYTSIPTVFINTPFGQPGSDAIHDMQVSDWNDPVQLDILNPQLFPAGMILFNTRRSTNNVKVWREEYLGDIDEFTVGNFLSDAYELSNPGAKAAAYDYIKDKPQRWSTYSGNDLQGVGLFGRYAQRISVVRAIAAQVIANQDIRSEFINYNLVTAPGYVELYDELITLNVDRKETAFIIADTPIDLPASGTAIERWAKNLNNASSNGREGLINKYEYSALYYPWALSTNVDGKEIVVPPSTAALRVYGYNDSVAWPWTPPAGTRRGKLTNASSVGYMDLENRQYVPVVLNQGQRDVLYENDINPLAIIPQHGLLVYGDKTNSSMDNSALSRINVARLIVYLRTILPPLLQPFLFELNTERTRKAAQEVVTSVCVDLMAKEALYDFVVSLEGNTPDVIDQNMLIVDVLIEPTKTINWVLVPIRIKKTGSL